MIWVILGVSFLIRLIGLDQSLWLDEAISANVARMPIIDIVKNFSVSDFHPPLYYLFLNVWTKIFGNGVVVMRMSSVLFSLVTIWLIYKIGKEIKNKKIGIWAAIFLGVNPLFIYFSQELRMYMMTVMLLTGALYFWIHSIKSEFRISWKNILGFNVLIFLSFLTFYGSIFLTATMLLYLLINKKFKLFFLDSMGIILAILVISPLLLTQIKYSGTMLTQVINWTLVLGKVNLKNLLLIPLKFSVGRVSWYPKIIYYATAGVWTLIVFGLVAKGLIKNKIWRWLMITPIILGIIFSIKSPLLQYFRFLYLVPILALVLAISIKSKVLKYLLTGGFLIFSVMYLFNSNMHREDWKGLTADLNENENIYMIESFADPIKYYNPKIKIRDIKAIEPSEDKITIVPFGGAIHGINFFEKLEKLGYRRTFEKSYRENKLEKWEMK